MNALTTYRLEAAAEHLWAAKFLLSGRHFKSTVVSSFFAQFNSMRALLVAELYKRKSFLAIVRRFHRRYIETNLFDEKYLRYFRAAFKARQYSDYGDFVVVSREEAQEQYEHASEFCAAVKKFLEEEK